MIHTIAFDADDTLWHNEELYQQTQAAFRTLLRTYHDDAWIDARILATEQKNLAHFGYGVKGFILSLIETAVELTDGKIAGSEVQQIIDLGKAMLSNPIEILPGADRALETLSHDHQLMLITKGDLFDQESKLARSGLGHYFTHVEVVSEKNIDTYREILQRHRIQAGEFLMVGNSLKSDILPVVALGGCAVHIPYRVTWQHEQVHGVEPETHGYHRLDSLTDLKDWMFRHKLSPA